MLFADLQCWFTVKPEKNKEEKRKKESGNCSTIASMHATENLWNSPYMVWSVAELQLYNYNMHARKLKCNTNQALIY